MPRRACKNALNYHFRCRCIFFFSFCMKSSIRFAQVQHDISMVTQTHSRQKMEEKWEWIFIYKILNSHWASLLLLNRLCGVGQSPGHHRQIYCVQNHHYNYTAWDFQFRYDFSFCFTLSLSVSFYFILLDPLRRPAAASFAIHKNK